METKRLMIRERERERVCESESESKSLRLEWLLNEVESE